MRRNEIGRAYDLFFDIIHDGGRVKSKRESQKIEIEFGGQREDDAGAVLASERAGAARAYEPLGGIGER
jgi:hypothetical protein